MNHSCVKEKISEIIRHILPVNAGRTGFLTGLTAIPENIGLRLAVDISLNIADIIKNKNM